MKLLRPILLGGMVAGALDITYAFIHFGLVLGASPIRIGQSVAAGLLGPDVAFAGGVGVGLFGLALHFLMATMMAAFFVLLASRIPALIRNAWIAGPVYGLGLYFVMNYLVVPLSNATHHGPPQGQFLLGALFTHTVLVGLPIALIAKRYLGK